MYVRIGTCSIICTMLGCSMLYRDLKLKRFSCFSHFQQYNYQDDDSPPHDQGFLRVTNEVTPELVHVSEKNLSEIENVHGYVSHSHISPLKVRIAFILTSFLMYVVTVRTLFKQTRPLSQLSFTHLHLQPPL